MSEPSGPALMRVVRSQRTWLGWIVGLAGALVVFLSIGFLIPVFIDPEERGELASLNAPIIVAYVLLAGALITRQSRRHLTRTLAWLADGRDPDEREHRATLRLGLHGAKLQGSRGSSARSPSRCSTRPPIPGSSPPWWRAPLGWAGRRPARSTT